LPQVTLCRSPARSSIRPWLRRPETQSKYTRSLLTRDISLRDNPMLARRGQPTYMTDAALWANGGSSRKLGPQKHTADSVVVVSDARHRGTAARRRRGAPGK